jgi:hypothetical protein
MKINCRNICIKYTKFYHLFTCEARLRFSGSKLCTYCTVIQHQFPNYYWCNMYSFDDIVSSWSFETSPAPLLIIFFNWVIFICSLSFLRFVFSSLFTVKVYGTDPYMPCLLTAGLLRWALSHSRGNIEIYVFLEKYLHEYFSRKTYLKLTWHCPRL